MNTIKIFRSVYYKKREAIMPGSGIKKMQRNLCGHISAIRLKNMFFESETILRFCRTKFGYAIMYCLVNSQIEWKYKTRRWTLKKSLPFSGLKFNLCTVFSLCTHPDNNSNKASINFFIYNGPVHF